MWKHLLFLAMLQLGPSHPGSRLSSCAHGIWLSWIPSPTLVDEASTNSAIGTVTINRATGDCTTNGGFSIVDAGVSPFGPWWDSTAVSGTTYAYTIDYVDFAYFDSDSGPSNCVSKTAP